MVRLNVTTRVEHAIVIPWLKELLVTVVLKMRGALILALVVEPVTVGQLLQIVNVT